MSDSLHVVQGVSPDKALRELIEGNERFVWARMARPNQSTVRRTDVAKGQRPFAAILGCADSRVPPELVFDQGLGDLFVLRVAGNIIDDAVLGSIEFGIEEFGIQLVVVLGHAKCGAVHASLEAIKSGGQAPGHVGSLVESLRPPLTELLREQPEASDLVEAGVRANVQYVVQQLRTSQPLLSEMVESDRVRVVGMRYDLASGRADVVDNAPVASRKAALSAIRQAIFLHPVGSI